MVNIAYEAPVDMAPRDQIEDAERRLFELAEKGRFNSGFQGFAEALKAAIDMAGAAYKRAGHLSGLATGLDDLDKMMGGLQNSDLVILAGRPGMGKTALATNIAYNVAKAWRGEQQPDGTIKTVDGGIVGFFSLEMSSEQLATRMLAEQAGVPSSDIRRGAIHEDQFDRIVEAAQEMQRIPLYIDQTGGISIGQLAARARRLKRQRGLDFLIIDYLQLIQGTRPPLIGEPRAGDHRDHHQPEGAGEGAERSDPGAVAALAPGGIARRQAPAAFRPARIGLHRAGRRRGALRLPRGVLSEEPQAEGRHRGVLQVAGGDGADRRAAPRSSSASSATARPARSRCSSRPR